MPTADSPAQPAQPSLAEIAREWGRIGCIGFGGPPAHVAARFERLLVDERVVALLAGAAPAAAGAILGSAVPLAAALGESWQYLVLVMAALALLMLRRGVAATLVVAGGVGATAGLLGAPLPH